MSFGTGHEVQIFSNVIGPYHIEYSISRSSDASHWTTGEEPEEEEDRQAFEAALTGW